jgi:chromosome partitioning protein
VPTQFESRESRHLRKSLEGRGVSIFRTALMERNAIRNIHMTGKVPRQISPSDKAALNVTEITEELLKSLELMQEEAA